MKSDTQPALFSETDEQLADILEKLPDADQDEVMSRMPAMLQSLVVLITSELDHAEVNASKKIAKRIVIALSTSFRGLKIYIPRDKQLRIALRDIDLYNEFNYRNHEYLSKKYDLTETQVYSIVKRQLAAEKRRRQMGLF